MQPRQSGSPSDAPTLIDGPHPLSPHLPIPHPTHQRLRRDERYGRGYTTLFFFNFAAFIAGFVAVVSVDSDVARAKAIAALVGVFGTSFASAFTYELVNGFGIGVGISFCSWHRSTVVDRSHHPLVHSLFLLAMLALAAMLLAAAGWIWVRVDDVAAWMAAYHAGRDRH